MLSKIKDKFRNINYLEEKKRFLLLALSLLLLLFLAASLLARAYARYESKAKLNANIDRALYIFKEDELAFNLEPEKIVPTDEDFVYKFSISNFNDTNESDVNFSYTLDLRSTTNLPLTIELYRNEVYGTQGITNILGGSVMKRDVDGAWYRTYKPSDEYVMNYTEKITDVYTLVIKFPKIYAEDTTYADAIENIEVVIKSKQII